MKSENKIFVRVFALLLCCLGLSVPALASQNQKNLPGPSLQIFTKARGETHRYSLHQETPVSSFFLEFKNGSKKPSRISLSWDEGHTLQSLATRILWSAKYREPAGLKKCSEYAVLKAWTQSAKICLEDKTATAKTFGLLNSFSLLLRR